MTNPAMPGHTKIGMTRLQTLAFVHHEDRSPTNGYAETREAAMAMAQIMSTRILKHALGFPPV
jgi:hypothetical protein